MCTKLIVFSLAFCLGLIFSQITQQNNRTFHQSFVLDEASLSNLQSIRSYPQNPTAEFFYNFQDAVAKNDKEIVASSLHFPLEINFVDRQNKSHLIKINNKQEFLINYYEIFDTSLKQFISQTEPEDFSICLTGEMQSRKLVMTHIYKNKSNDFDIKVIKIIKEATFKLNGAN